MYKYVRDILAENNLIGETYVEPFAGGAGLAIKLLLNGDVKRIIINDYDIAIYSIWNCILNHTDEFCQLIENAKMTLDEWDRQRQIYLNTPNYTLELGFAAFYLNRTNHSGVLKGGMIGGREQVGNYKIDARFNKERLIDKIRLISQHREQILLTNLDAADFLTSGLLNHYYKIFINFDPPYVIKGSQLYKNSYTEADHRDLYSNISRCSRKWMVTYDMCPLVKELYSNYRASEVNITYTVTGSKHASEYVFFSNNLQLPNTIELI